MLSGLFLISVSSALVWVGTLNSSRDMVKKESMSIEDAKMFPVIGSVVLVSLFFALRYLAKDMINTLFRALFSVTGTLAVYKILKLAYRQFTVKSDKAKVEEKKEKEEKKKTAKKEADKPVEKSETEKTGEEEEKAAQKIFTGNMIADNWHAFKTEAKEAFSEIKECTITYAAEMKELPNALLFGLAVALNIWYFKTKSINSSNILASAFSVMGIQEIKPDSTRTVLVLLSLLFVYDIFWVYCTPVMLGVAKGLDLPIKIVYPFSKKGASMIGLGDIVIPGFFLSLARDFAHKYTSPLVFTLGFIGYIIALIITFAVVLIFKAGQPALLYICPLIVAGSITGAAIHKRTKQFIDYKTE